MGEFLIPPSYFNRKLCPCLCVGGSSWLYISKSVIFYIYRKRLCVFLYFYLVTISMKFEFVYNFAVIEKYANIVFAFIDAFPRSIKTFIGKK